jgi:hypothetical protein
MGSSPKRKKCNKEQPSVCKNDFDAATHFFVAYCDVHSRAVLIASGWFSCFNVSHVPEVATAQGTSPTFHCLATASLSGSSGLGAPSKAWILSRIVRICRAGDQLFFSTSKQMRPSLSMFG